MTGLMQHHMELVADTATLYVTGSLRENHVDTLIAACAAAPQRVRTLRLDLHGLGQLGAESVGVVRQLLRFWRDTRHGDFRLATSHLVATLHDTREGPVPIRPGWGAPQMNDALAATYL